MSLFSLKIVALYIYPYLVLRKDDLDLIKRYTLKESPFLLLHSFFINIPITNGKKARDNHQ